jgi:branched-subunit amino acid transport protein
VSPFWLTILVLSAGTIVIKAAGPVLLGGRALPARLNGVISLLAPALLAALLAVQTFGTSERGLVVDERVVGLAAAAVALALKRGLTVVILVAAIATALARALT